MTVWISSVMFELIAPLFVNFLSVELLLHVPLDVFVEPLVSIFLHVDPEAILCFLFDVKVYLEVSAREVLELSSVHLYQSGLGSYMFLVENICKAFALASLPVAADAYLLNLTEGTEPVADVILFEGVRKVLYKQCFAVLWH